MKKIFVLLTSSLICLFSCSAKTEDEIVDTFPKGGVYVGIGVNTTSEKYDFNMQSVPDDAHGEYKDLLYSSSIRNHSGLVLIGYKIRTPLFLAIEFSIDLNRQKEDHEFQQKVGNPNPVEQNSAILRLWKGIDSQFVFKLGKSICNFTPYAVLGWHKRKYGFSLEYPYYEGQDDYRYANRNYKQHRSGFVYGLGFSHYMENGFDICIEYVWKRNDSICQFYPAAFNEDANLDENGFSRKYTIKNRTQRSFSLMIIKTFSIF